MKLQVEVPESVLTVLTELTAGLETLTPIINYEFITE